MLITERIYVLEDVDVQAFLGVNNSNLMLLRTLFPKLRLVAHHNVLMYFCLFKFVAIKALARKQE